MTVECVLDALIDFVIDLRHQKIARNILLAEPTNALGRIWCSCRVRSTIKPSRVDVRTLTAVLLTRNSVLKESKFYAKILPIITFIARQFLTSGNSDY